MRMIVVSSSTPTLNYGLLDRYPNSGGCYPEANKKNLISDATESSLVFFQNASAGSQMHLLGNVVYEALSTGKCDKRIMHQGFPGPRRRVTDGVTP